VGKESGFQAKLIVELKELFPGSVILKNDPNYIQGFPDLTILFEEKWAVLECKKSEDASSQPNQDYYVDKLSKMSYAKFIHPDNKEEVLGELQQAFRPRGSARLSRR